MTAELTMLGRDFAGYRDAIAEQQQAWRGGSVRGDWRPFPDLEQSVLHGTVCTDGTADLIMVPADWIPALAAAGSILPLETTDAAPSMLGPEGWDVWAPSFRPAVSHEGRYWGLPYHDGPQLLFRRTDLYSDPDERERYRAVHGRELGPPHDWDELELQARWFTRPGDGLWGTVFAGLPDGHNNVYDFVAALWRYGGDLFDESGAPSFDSAQGVRAALWLREMFATVVTAGAHDLDSVASGDEFAAGRVAVAVNWAGFAAMATTDDSAVLGRFRCDPVMPGVPTVNAFWAVAIAAGTAHPDAALDFVSHLADPAMDRITTLRGACGARTSSWNDREILERYPEQALFAAAHENSRPLPPVPHLPAVVAELNSAVDDIVHGGADAAARLAAAAARVAAQAPRSSSASASSPESRSVN